MVWLGEYWMFIVKCFIKTESYLALQYAFCKIFKWKRHYSVPPCVTISKQSKTFWETSAAIGAVGERGAYRGELRKTVSGSQGGPVNLTSITHFFITFLTQYQRVLIHTNLKLLIRTQRHLYYTELLCRMSCTNTKQNVPLTGAKYR